MRLHVQMIKVGSARVTPVLAASRLPAKRQAMACSPHGRLAARQSIMSTTNGRLAVWGILLDVYVRDD